MSSNNLITVFRKPKRSPEDIEIIREFITKIEELKPYINNLSNFSLEEIALNLGYLEFSEVATIFNKGDRSEKLYIILKGDIALYDIDRDGRLILIAAIGPGKLLGERGLIRNLPRSLTAIAKKNSKLLYLDISKFKYIINTQSTSNIDEKVEFIESKFPKSESFSLYQKEKLAYYMNSKQFNRDDTIISEGVMTECLMFLYTGECMLKKKIEDKQMKILYIEKGCMIADECVFFSQTSKFSYIVTSEVAKVYFIKKQDLMIQTPSAIVKKLTKISFISGLRKFEILEGVKRLRNDSKNYDKITKYNFPFANQNFRVGISRSLKKLQVKKLPSLQQTNCLNNTKVELLKLRERFRPNQSFNTTSNSSFFGKSLESL